MISAGRSYTQLATGWTKITNNIIMIQYRYMHAGPKSVYITFLLFIHTLLLSSLKDRSKQTPTEMTIAITQTHTDTLEGMMYL